MNRVQLVRSHLDSLKLSNKPATKDTVTITDNRSGKGNSINIFRKNIYLHTFRRRDQSLRSRKDKRLRRKPTQILRSSLHEYNQLRKFYFKNLDIKDMFHRRRQRNTPI